MRIPVVADGYVWLFEIGTPKSMVIVAVVVATAPCTQLKIRSPAGSVNPVSVSRLTGVLPTPQVSCAFAAFDRPNTKSIANTGKIFFIFSIRFVLLVEQ